MRSQLDNYTMSFKIFRRSIFGIARDQNQVYSVEVDSDPNSPPDDELESFQHLVFSQFDSLSASSANEFLSLNWLSKLLDAFVVCQEEFKVILLKKSTILSKPPLDKLLTEFLDRSVKALDICNAIRDGIEKTQHWNKHLEIVPCAFDSKRRNVMREGQFRRARKALNDLAIVMLDVSKDSGSVFSNKSRSSRRSNKGKYLNRRKRGHTRSPSWSVSNSWSASKQLNSMAYSLIPPRAKDITATNGLANVFFTMGFITMFILWALVAAIPCQDRNLQINFSIPRHFSWATPLYLLQTRILDESKKRNRKNSVGLLSEINQMEKSVCLIKNLVESAHQFPLTERKKEEVKEGVEEVTRVCNAFKKGLDPFERQVREVFRKITSCRIEGLEILGKAQS